VYWCGGRVRGQEEEGGDGCVVMLLLISFVSLVFSRRDNG